MPLPAMCHTGAVNQVRHFLAAAVVIALLAPVLALTLSCQAQGTDAIAAMACCRKAHSACMQGEKAGTDSCCCSFQARPQVALNAANAEHGAPALVPVAALVAYAALPVWRTPAATVSPTPPISLYSLHASLLI